MFVKFEMAWMAALQAQGEEPYFPVFSSAVHLWTGDAGTGLEPSSKIVDISSKNSYKNSRQGAEPGCLPIRRDETVKPILVAAIILSVIVAGFIGLSFYRNYSMNHGFKEIKIGDPESKVVLRMGKPGKVVFQGEKGFWSSNIEGSVREYHYTARILPEIWIIGLNSRGEVVYRNHNLM
jgi:hypothetical protein